MEPTDTGHWSSACFTFPSVYLKLRNPKIERMINSQSDVKGWDNEGSRFCHLTTVTRYIAIRGGESKGVPGWLHFHSGCHLCSPCRCPWIWMRDEMMMWLQFSRRRAEFGLRRRCERDDRSVCFAWNREQMTQMRWCVNQSLFRSIANSDKWQDFGAFKWISNELGGNWFKAAQTFILVNQLSQVQWLDAYAVDAMQLLLLMLQCSLV